LVGPSEVGFFRRLTGSALPKINVGAGFFR
jgi:hypothetical protein